MSVPRIPRSGAVGLLSLLLTGGSPALSGEVELTFGGYIKLDAMVSDYSGGDLPPDSHLRDFHYPGAIPIGGISEETDVDFHAKETRFDFKLHRDLGGGHEITGYIELDFLMTDGGNERVSNSYTPRLRHAWFGYDDWLFGQTWSTFMIVVLPEDLDFIGVPDGTTFLRGPQIRYTRGPWQFALENPETTVTPNGGGAMITTDDVGLPELVARYNHERGWGSVSAAAIFRWLEYDDGPTEYDGHGWGVSVGGKIEIRPTDDVVYQATTGSGLGRHLALNVVSAAVIDVGGDLDPIDSTGGFVGLRHRWNDRLRTSVNYATFKASNPVLDTGLLVNESVHSYSLNLLYSPRPELTFGGEYIHGEREIESGESGDLDRFQFSAKYSFNVAS